MLASTEQSLLCREGIRGNQLKVDVADILSYNDELAKYVEENPSESLPLVRRRQPGTSVHNKMAASVVFSTSPPGSCTCLIPSLIGFYSWRRRPPTFGGSRRTTLKTRMGSLSSPLCKSCCTAAAPSARHPSASSRWDDCLQTYLLTGCSALLACAGRRCLLAGK